MAMKESASFSLCFLLLFMFCTIGVMVPTPDGEFVHLSSLNVIGEPREVFANNDEDPICGYAIMQFVWIYDKIAGASRDSTSSEIHFYSNGTFIDVTYDYTGPWYDFGTNGNEMLVYDYTSSTYLSPTNDGQGSMINHGTLCGTWSFSSWKWECPNVCTAQ